MFVHMGEGIHVGRRDLPFSVLAEKYRLVDLLPVPYPLLGFSTSPSLQPFALAILGLPFLNVLFWHRFLEPSFLLVDECDIEGGLFARGIPLFWDLVKF